MQIKKPNKDAAIIRFSDTTPPAPPGATNVKWQKAWPNLSAYVDWGESTRDIVVFDPPLGSPPTVAPEIVFFQDADGRSHVLWFNS